jgi:hypothetical protein
MIFFCDFKVWVIDSHRATKSDLVSTDGLWMNGYIMANPEDENLNDGFTRGESKKWLSSSSVKSPSNQRPAFAASAGRLQSLCLFGSACESYNDHAIMNAEHSSSKEVDRGLPHDISDAVKKEVHDAIDAELNEQDLDHVIKTGSPTNAFRTHPRASPITLVAFPKERARQRDSRHIFLGDPTAEPAVNSARGGALSGAGAAYQVRRAIRAFRQYERTAAMEGDAEERPALRRRRARASPFREHAAAAPPAAQDPPRSYPPLPAY